MIQNKTTSDIHNDPEKHLPEGVRILPLDQHDDNRGSLVEFYRQEWILQQGYALQWNHVISKPNVLRGIHVHHTHWDYLYMAHGSMELALTDIRRGSPGFCKTIVVQLHAGQSRGVIIPPGVAHGFYFTASAVLIYGVSHYWNPDDELGCMWNDSSLEISWQARNPLLSKRDQTAGSFEQMVKEYESFVNLADTEP